MRARGQAVSRAEPAQLAPGSGIPVPSSAVPAVEGWAATIRLRPTAAAALNSAWLYQRMHVNPRLSYPEFASEIVRLGLAAFEPQTREAVQPEGVRSAGAPEPRPPAAVPGLPKYLRLERKELLIWPDQITQLSILARVLNRNRKGAGGADNHEHAYPRCRGTPCSAGPRTWRVRRRKNSTAHWDSRRLPRTRSRPHWPSRPARR
jgi:hypothetical protein